MRKSITLLALVVTSLMVIISTQHVFGDQNIKSNEKKDGDKPSAKTKQTNKAPRDKMVRGATINKGIQ